MSIRRPQRRPTVGELFEYHHGLHYKNSLLWFDAVTPRPLSFISHALVANAYQHQKVITTDATAELLRIMADPYGRGRKEHEPQLLVTPCGRPFSLGPLKLELLPAGYVLGSASLRVRHRNRTIIYAGQINPQSGEHSLIEKLQPQPCDVLVLPCGFNAHHRLALPDADRVRRQLLRFVESTVDDKQVPVLLCPPLGEAQRLVRMLEDQKRWTLRLHRQIYALTQVFARRSPKRIDLSGVRRYEGPIDPGSKSVVIWPSRLYASPALARQKAARLTLISAAAQNKKLRQQLGCEAGFALSSQADYRSLLAYVHDCSPKTVILTGNPSAELAEDLRALGLDVYLVGPKQQLNLF